MTGDHDHTDPTFVVGAVLAQLEDLTPSQQRQVLADALAQIPPDPEPDYNAERNRSYDVRRAIMGDTGHDYPGGSASAVWLTARRRIPGGIAEGEVVRLVSTSNAGFRGIEATVRRADDERFYHASLGVFDITTKGTNQ